MVTEDLNRHWYERNASQMVTDVQRQVRHPVNRWMGATLDGMVAGTGAVFEAKFMLPWSFSEEAAACKHISTSATVTKDPSTSTRNAELARVPDEISMLPVPAAQTGSCC